MQIDIQKGFDFVLFPFRVLSFSLVLNSIDGKIIIVWVCPEGESSCD